jgi:hypothetical protein
MRSVRLSSTYTLALRTLKRNCLSLLVKDIQSATFCKFWYAIFFGLSSILDRNIFGMFSGIGLIKSSFGSLLIGFATYCERDEGEQFCTGGGAG